jgi:antitoxin (DNA-binding transcriptional repressor) of toxin-antitoxin stability system
MKRVTASEARKNWFRLLDEVAEGETVVIQRRGRRIVLRREEKPRTMPVPDYSEVLRAPEIERADEWHWEWPGPEGGLQFRDRDNAP